MESREIIKEGIKRITNDKTKLNVGNTKILIVGETRSRKMKDEKENKGSGT